MKPKTNLPVAIGLDIGSSAVRCVIGLAQEDNPAPSIVGLGEAPNGGVRRGIVVDIDETVSAITTAVEEAERISGININRATVGVNGSQLLTVGSHGVIAIGAVAREISEEDVSRAEEAAAVMQLPPNREIIQAFARSYQIDGQDHIKDPVGMSGLRLEVEMGLVTAATPFIKNLGRAVSQAGINLDNLVANPLAAAQIVADKNRREQGVVVVDIGASTTGLAVFEEGELLQVAVLPVGAGHITNDLAIGLRTEIETAEKLKLEHVNADPKHSHAERQLTIKELSGEELTVSYSQINSIAKARLAELFDLINKDLSKIKRDGLLPGGAILCGGGANLAGIAELAKHSLRLPARIGKSEGFSGIVDKISNPAYATVLGLMVENLQAEHPSGTLGSVMATLGSSKDFVQKLLNKISRR